MHEGSRRAGAWPAGGRATAASRDGALGRSRPPGESETRDWTAYHCMVGYCALRHLCTVLRIRIAFSRNKSAQLFRIRNS